MRKPSLVHPPYGAVPSARLTYQRWIRDVDISFNATSPHWGMTYTRSSRLECPSVEPMIVPASPCCQSFAAYRNGLYESLGSMYRFDRMRSSISALNASASAR